MDIKDLIEIGLAGTDRDRVDIVDLEPVEVAPDGVVGLSAIVSQLLYNATELLSVEGEKVLISGGVEPDGYSLLIIDHGIGMSDEFLEGLNHILANPPDSDDRPAASGVQVVAGLAARHGMRVRLEHGDPGVTARVSIPLRLLDVEAPAIADPFVVAVEDPATEPEYEYEPERVLASAKPLAMDTEAFLESIFGPLRDAPAVKVADSEVVDIRPAPAVTTPVRPDRAEPAEAPEPLTGYRRATLRTRIPGRNYNESDPTPAHTKPGEAAVEIKLALADFTRGRRAAAEPTED